MVQLCSVRKKSGKAEWLFSTGFSIDWAYRSNTQIYQFRSCAGFQNHDYCFHIALIANSVCLYLLQKSKSEEAHMKATMIFTSNDIIINTGVIAAGVLVLLTQSKYPDLIIGAIVFLIVVRGGLSGY